jgi:hypothetical protein
VHLRESRFEPAGVIVIRYAAAVTRTIARDIVLLRHRIG